MEAVFRPCRLSTVTSDLVSLFRAAIERGKIELGVHCEADIPLDSSRAVYMAEELWEKVVFNLVGNAFKYTLQGRIDVRVYYTSREAVIEVADTGCTLDIYKHVLHLQSSIQAV